MNDADSQFLADRAMAAGYELAHRPEEAAIVVLNTCTVRDNAERRAYGRVHHFKLLKLRDPRVKLVVTGCLAEQDRDRMQRLAPHVDAIFGTKELSALADRLRAWRPEYDDLAALDDETIASEGTLVESFGGTPDGIADAFSPLRAFVTVQRGCSYYCTFCIVPHVRGRFDHRTMEEILDETSSRVAAGAREVMLVGQTVNAWRDAVRGADFADLCRAAGATPGVERLTFISPHPKDFTQATIAALSEIPVMAPRVHLPLQSGSDAILRRMNRKYTRAAFEERVEWIRHYLPHWAITTDIIVGFPGETEEDFERTLELVREGVFANAFTFMYSPRRGTPAARWEPVDPLAVADRFARLVEAQNAATHAYHARKTGTTVRALLTGTSKRDSSMLAAKSGDNVTLVARKPFGYDDAEYARTPWVDVVVESAHLWGCKGSIVRRARRMGDAGVAVSPAAIDLIAG